MSKTSGTIEPRDFLAKELANRCKADQSYSIRRFARDLDISPSHLSHILSGKFGTSKKTAEKVAVKLGLTANERDYFLDLVLAKHARSNHERQSAKKRLKSSRPRYRDFHPDSFDFTARWYVLPLIELSKTIDYMDDARWVAQQFDVPEVEVKQVMRYLKKLGLLRTDDATSPTVVDPIFINREGISSSAVREAHHHLISRAQIALQSQNISEREFAHLSVAVGPEDIPVVKRMIDEFQTELDRVLATSTARKNTVYGLNIQFFRIPKHASNSPNWS